MRRAPLALLLGALMIVTPLAAAAANNHGSGQVANAPTIVTFLDPVVNLPGTVSAVDFVKEHKGKTTHSSSSEMDPMEFAGKAGRSVRIQLMFSGKDVESDLAPLLALAKQAQQNDGVAHAVLVWGDLGAFTVTFVSFDPNDVLFTDQGQDGRPVSAAVNVTAEEAAPASDPPRSLTFVHGDPGVATWVLDFAFAPTPNWTKHRDSHGNSPDLEFTSAQGRSMNFELLFDGFEKHYDVRPAVAILVDHSFETPVHNATIPMDFDWGLGPTLRGFVTNVTVEYTLFLPDATPVRAIVRVGMAGVHTVHGEPAAPAAPYTPQISFLDPDLGPAGVLIAMDVWFNHTDDNHDMAVAWDRHAHADSPPQEFKAAEPMNMSVELLFDTWEQKSNVKLALGPLLNLTFVANEEKRPPKVVFTWGDTVPQFEGVLESLAVKYTLFLEDGTPVRATVNLKLQNASQASTSHARVLATDHNGTTESMDGKTSYNLAQREWANITLTGPITPSRRAMVDWVLAMANGSGSSLQVTIRFRLPAPSAGAWVCTQVTYLPPQFGPDGPSGDTITFRVDLAGLKQGEVPTFSQHLKNQRCVIDQDTQSSNHRQRPDEFQKATGFTVDINGSRSQADAFEGGAISVALGPDQVRAGHYKPGKASFAPLIFTRVQPLLSEWQEWFNASQKLPGGLRLNFTINLTGANGDVVDRWNFYEGWPTKWYTADMDSDQSGMAIEKIEIAVEKVERA